MRWFSRFSAMAVGATALAFERETPGVLGWRVAGGKGDLAIAAAGPAGERVLVARADLGGRRGDEAHTVAIGQPGEGLIVAVGTIQWSWALDALGRHKDDEGRETPVDPRLQALTRNILAALRKAR